MYAYFYCTVLKIVRVPMKTKRLLKFQCIEAVYVCPGIQHMEFPLSFMREVPFRLLAFSRSE